MMGGAKRHDLTLVMHYNAALLSKYIVRVQNTELLHASLQRLFYSSCRGPTNNQCIAAVGNK